MDVFRNDLADHEGDIVGNSTMVQIPRMGGVNENLNRVMEMTRTRGRPTNTSKAYDGKKVELVQYLDTVWAHDDHPRLLNKHKVYRFVFYQCAREKRLYRRGQRGNATTQFDTREYQSVISKYDVDSHNGLVPFLEPKNGLRFQALRQYKAVIKEYFQNQLENQTRGWEFIWTPNCNVLLNIVRNRGPLQKLKNFDEKVSHALSPFTIVHRYPEIENNLYMKGMRSLRTAVTELRNRYVLTHTTSGILRFESLEKACLSDFLCTIFRKEEDVHPLLIMITQVFTGKHNRMNMQTC